MKQQMTRNQFQEYLKNNAARFYNEKGYTMEDFKRDADNVEILGFDLDKYGLSAEMQKVINDAFSSESVNKHGNMFVKGHYNTFSYVNGIADALDCKLVSSGVYNGFYKNDNSRLVLEYCEGDVSLILCETKEAYFKEVASYFKFYQVDRSVFMEGTYNLYRGDCFQGKGFSEKEVKEFILECTKLYPDDDIKVTRDIKNGYNESFVDVSLYFFDLLNVRLPCVEDNACIEVYFDGVHVDNVYTSIDKAEAMEYSLVQNGYDNYNGDVKEDWERSGGRYNPDLSFIVVEYPEKTVNALISDAKERSARTDNVQKNIVLDMDK